MRVVVAVVRMTIMMMSGVELTWFVCVCVFEIYVTNTYTLKWFQECWCHFTHAHAGRMQLNAHTEKGGSVLSFCASRCPANAHTRTPGLRVSAGGRMFVVVLY